MFRIILLILLLNGCTINPINRVQISDSKKIKTEISNTKDTESLAKLYFKLGKSRESSFEINLAIDAFEKAIKKYKQFHSNADNLNVAKCYDELGKIYSFKQEYSKSLKYFQNSYKIKKNYFSAINKSLVMSCKYIGEVYIKLNNIEKALFSLRKAERYSTHIDNYNPSPLTLEIRAKISSLQSKQETSYRGKIRLRDYILKYGEKSIEVANLYREMAKEYNSKGKFDLAFDAYIDSTEIYEEILLPYKEELYTTFFELSNVSKKIGKYKEYLEASIKTFDSYFENRQKIFSTFDIEEQMKFSKKRKKYLYNLFDALSLYKSEESIKKVFNLWINYKRGIFDFENSLYMFSKKDNNLKSKYDEWNRKRRELANLEQEMSNHSSKEIAKKISNLEKEMSYIFSQYNNKIDYQQISKKLDKKELYIDFAKVGRFYYIFTLSSNNSITFKKLEAKKIDILIKRIRKDIDTHKEKGDFLITREEYAPFYDLIIRDNIDIENINSLVVSTDGLLDLIPFEAFYNKKRKKYLLEELTVRYIPSGKEFVKLYKSDILSSNKEIVAFTNPNYGLNTENSEKNNIKGVVIDALQDVKFGQLKNIVEANTLKKIYGKRLSLFQEKNATELNFFKINAPKILHISTHGFYLNDKNILNPMLKVGIALSGANYSIKNKKGDGIVTGLELSGLNLHGTELVVLSACKTGVGKLENSEGVSGIHKAFINTGAKYIVATLWSVDEESTANLMRKFYHYIDEGKSYNEALRKAKLDYTYLPPFYWSGFVGSGKD